MSQPFVESATELSGKDASIPTLHISKKQDARGAPKLNYDRLARLVHAAMDQLGTEEEDLYKALQELNQDVLAVDELNRAYFKLYGSVLIDDIDGEMDGDELEFAMQLLGRGEAGSPQRIEKGPVDFKAAAERINDALGGLGTEEEEVYAALIPLRRDPASLRKLRETYRAEYGEDLIAEIKDEMSDDELDYALHLALDVKEAYDYYLVRASEELNTAVPGGRAIGNQVTDNPLAKYDKEFWVAANHKDGKGNEVDPGLRLLPGKNPSDAIRSLYASMSKAYILNFIKAGWKVDCAEWVQVHHLHAMRMVLGDYRLDEKFSGKPFWYMDHRSTGLSTKMNYTRENATGKMHPALLKDGAPVFDRDGMVINDDRLPSEDVEALLARAPLGSRVCFMNLVLKDDSMPGYSASTIDQAWQNENTMKLGPDRFSAHGSAWGTLFTRREIMLESLKYGQNPELSEEENLRQMVFIGDIEIYRTIADEPWTEWAAGAGPGDLDAKGDFGD